MDQKFIEALYFHESKSFVATDEVGRGCLAGPVTVASIKIHELSISNLKKLKEMGIGDSKKISKKKRLKIIQMLGLNIDLISGGGGFTSIVDDLRIEIKIVHIPVEVIDQINILQATFKGMLDSKIGLLEPTDIWLIDGNAAPKTTHSLVKTIIQGDSKSILIGLASILAKEARDALLKKISIDFPEYDWENNAGYGTKKHLLAISQFGLTDHHRKSFKIDLSKIV